MCENPLLYVYRELLGNELKTLGCKVPLVYCTADTDQMLKKIPIGCSILQKPFKSDEMLLLIRENLKRAKNRKLPLFGQLLLRERLYEVRLFTSGMFLREAPVRS